MAHPQCRPHWRASAGGFPVAILGRTLALSEGRIDFTGGGLANPSLRLMASARRSGVTANAILCGSVRDPTVTFSSVPSLPQDEVLSRLLFSTGTDRLSLFQVAQLANAHPRSRLRRRLAPIR